jgi:hypothetical protein
MIVELLLKNSMMHGGGGHLRRQWQKDKCRMTDGKCLAFVVYFSKLNQGKQEPAK